MADGANSTANAARRKTMAQAIMARKMTHQSTTFADSDVNLECENEDDDEKKDEDDDKKKTRTTHVWTHPAHKRICFFATLFKLFALGFTAVAMWAPSFIDQDGDDHELKDVICNKDGVCMLEEHAKMKKIELEGTIAFLQILYYIIAVTDAINLLQLIVFWIICLRFKLVFNLQLRVGYILCGIFSYLKFLAACLLAHEVPKIHKVYAWGTPNKDREYNNEIYPYALRLSTLAMSFMFFGFLLDVVCMTGLIVATDKGAPGEPTHLQRLAKEEEERAYEEELARQIEALEALEELVPDLDMETSFDVVANRRKSFAPEGFGKRKKSSMDADSDASVVSPASPDKKIGFQ